MRLIANGTQAGATLPAPAAASGTPGYANNNAPGPGQTPTDIYPDDINIILAEMMAILTAAGVSPDNTGANTGQVLASLQLLHGPGRLLNVQVFAAGTSTYTPTSGTNSVIVEVEGAGGGSAGSAATSASTISACGPGGPGGYARSRITSGFAGQTITVGAGGAAGVASNGGTGGTTSFGALLSATAGGGGQYVVTGNTGNIAAAPGTSGTGVGGDENASGGPSLSAWNFAGAGGSGLPGAPVIGGGSYGCGGIGFALPPSSSARNGYPGKTGMVRILEFA